MEDAGFWEDWRRKMEESVLKILQEQIWKTMTKSRRIMNDEPLPVKQSLPETLRVCGRLCATARGSSFKIRRDSVSCATRVGQIRVRHRGNRAA